MQLKVSAWSIRNPIPVSVLFIVLLLAGIAGYLSLPIKLFPDTTSPTIQVSIILPGAAATEMESQITREVEGAVANIAGVRHVQSTVNEGSSVTTVEFEIGEDTQQATDEVRSAVDEVRNTLPREIEEPIVEHLKLESTPVLTYAVAAQTMSDLDLSWFIDDTVSRSLVAAEGVAQVTRIGGVEREINVTVDPVRLAARGLTASALNDALRTYNVDAPGGRTDIGSREQTLRVLGAATTVEKLADTVIPTTNGTRVRLRDIATVQNGAAERRGFAMLDGTPVVGFQVSKTTEASDVVMEESVKAAVETLQQAHPDVRFTLIVSTARSTRASYQATLHTLVEGMVLAALVVLLFLRDWRSTMIAAVAMPLSLIPTFAIMQMLGFSLNTITLLGLTLVIGILVDDAIVEIENIEKRIERGETPYEAALEGADAIGLAVLATTATIMVVFLPVSFMGGVAGQFFKEFGLTVAIAVFFSLLVARFVTPPLAAYFLKAKPGHAGQKPFTGRYRRTLEFCLKHRWLSLGAGLLLFVGALGLATQVPTGFTPAEDSGIINLSVEGVPGSTVPQMHQAAATVTELLKRQSEVGSVFVSMGSTSSDGNVGSGTATILLNGDRARTTQEFQADMRALLVNVPNVRLSISQGGGGSSTVEVILASEDAAVLDGTALKLEQQMRSIPGLINVRQTMPHPNAELVVRLRNDEAARLGVTSAAVASLARVATTGDVDANVPKFNYGQERLPIRVRLPQSGRSDLATIGNLRVPTTTGATVPLRAVADISFEPGVTSISRFDRARRATVQAEVDGLSLGQANQAIAGLPVMKSLPDGVTQPSYGQSESMQELFGGFIVAIGAGILLIYGVLVLLFRSFFKPVTILAALPLSISGAILGLMVSGSEMDLPALIGLLLLMGLAAKNSILLVEFAIEAERAGTSQHDALIEACRERARPIVMTTLAMAAGMLPAAIGIGEGAEVRQPLAIAVIGGLMSSTLLSLILVPVVYEVVDDFENRLLPRLARLLASGPDHRRRLEQAAAE